MFKLNNIMNLAFTDSLYKGIIPVKHRFDKRVANGSEQKKIEDFLDKKGIGTIAFGRET